MRYRSAPEMKFSSPHFCMEYPQLALQTPEPGVCIESSTLTWSFSKKRDGRRVSCVQVTCWCAFAAQNVVQYIYLLLPMLRESAGVTNELTAIVGEPSIEMLQKEAVESEPRELVWLLNLPGQVTPRWHPQPVLCEPNIEDKAELRFV
jgi:hypothetical protein